VKHSEAHSRMAAYLEGELDVERRALFDAHLDQCPRCRTEFVELRETIGLLHALPDPEPPPFLVETVMRRIREGEGRITVLDRVRDALAVVASPRVAVPATALVVGLMLATGQLRPTQLALPELASAPISRSVSKPGGQLVVKQSNSRSANPTFERRFVSSPVTSLPNSNFASLPNSQSAARPPVVGRAPRITIQIPVLSGQVVSTPGRGIPLAQGRPQQNVARVQQGTSGRSVQPQRPVSGVVQAGTSEVASAMSTRSQDFSQLSGATAREQRKHAELRARLKRLLLNPTAYSVEFASLTVTEQDIWLEALAVYATELGRGEEALLRLRNAGDGRADALATALATQLRLAEADHRREVASLPEQR
jgi:hypothetical protein